MANLTVTHTEDITLNGQQFGGTTIKSFSGINEISKRILTITTAECVIGTFSSAVASAGHYTAADVRYIRFSNLDGTNFVTLTFRNQDNDEVAIKLDVGQTLVLNGDNTNAASSANFGSLTNIQADADTGSCNLEVIIASV